MFNDSAVHKFARAVPNTMPGKARLVRAVMQAAGVEGREITIAGEKGLSYQVPDLSESVAFNLFCFGAYERETRDVLMAALPEGGTLLDGGGNIGAISVPIAHARPDARIISVEGDPQVAAYLRRNVEANGLTNVTVVNALLGPADHETVRFFPAPSRKFGMGSMGDHFGSEAVELPMRSIDGIVAELGGSVDVLKLDIEGAEALALRGGSQVLDTAPTVIFEFQDWAERKIEGQAPGDSQRLLLDKGFSIAMMTDPSHVLAEPKVTGSAMLTAKRS